MVGMRGAVMLAVLAISVALLCVPSSSAFRISFQDTSSLLPGGPGRSLQEDALSNSNGCLGTIPKCEQAACATRSIQGSARWVCLRCSGNYEPVVDSSGQDNIVQCVCPRGTYEVAHNATACTRCPTNAYCTGGDKVENPVNRGSITQCGAGLITRNTGARSAADCLAPAGFAMTSPTAAAACGPSEYAPQFNRLNKCLKCQGGLEEEVPSPFVDGQRTSKREVCKVPPGKYVSQGLVRLCPQGFYRANYAAFDAAIAQICVSCSSGITTTGAGAKSAAECSRVVPGHGVNSISEVSGSQLLPVLPMNETSGLPAASLCELGYYSVGGFCAACPSGTVTRVRGAKSIEECVVPPGYVVSSGSMVLCSSGTFREGWLMFSDPRATTCTACGDNIMSEPRDLDENPLAANGSLVPASSASCFIEAGQGMIVTGRNTFKGLDCPANTYGVSGRVYGWSAAPCKPCPRNMITDGVSGATSSDVCINPGGFGYASEGASRCPLGFYAEKGSRRACRQCPPGRTTQDDAERQQFVTHCDVERGHGVVAASAPADGDIFAADLTGMTEMAILSMSVLQCPTGYWGGGDTLGAKCQRCPEGSSTKEPGSTSLADCDVCIPGHGRANSTSPCVLCEYGFWQPGGLAECLTCPDATFYPPVDGLGTTYTSRGSTFSRGATGVDWCVPMQSQLSPEAGQAYFTPEFAKDGSIDTFFSSNADSLDECVSSCQAEPDKCCLVQFDAVSLTCQKVTLAAADVLDAGPQMFYKLPPSTMSAASSVRDAQPAGQNKAQNTAPSGSRPASHRAPRVQAGSQRTFIIRRRGAGTVSAASDGGNARAKMLSSGLYARCAIPEAQAAAWSKVGSQLTLNARTFAKGPDEWLDVANIGACQILCDNSNVCWGGIYQDGKCLFRGGIDALSTRAFFALYEPGTTPGAIAPIGTEYYYTFSSSNGSALAALTTEQLTLLQTALHNALEEVLPVALNASAVTWVQTPYDPQTQGTEVGFSLIDAAGNALTSDLSGLFVGNASTTATVARKLLELCMAKTGGPDEFIFTGLFITSSDGAQQALETPPILVDGCTLLPNFCGANGSGSCTLNVCSCKAGWTGYTCMKAAGALP